MTGQLPFKVGCFYDAESVAAAFVSAGRPVSVRSVRRWIDQDASLRAARVRIAGRCWLPGAALLAWLGAAPVVAPAHARDAAGGFFVSARTEGELRRKVVQMEATA